MIAASPATRIFLFEGAVDMRKGFEWLSALVRDKLAEAPISGHLFVLQTRHAAVSRSSFGMDAACECAEDGLNAAAFDGPPGRARSGQARRCACARPSFRCCWTDWISRRPKSAGGGARTQGECAKMGPVF